MKELFSLHQGLHNVFQTCMMGGERDKKTKWWSSKGYFNAVNIMSDGLHSHKPWTPAITGAGLHFPAKEEASYPQLLCDRVAHVVRELAVEICFSPMESLVEQSKQQSSAALQHVNTSFLPRGRKLKLLVSEFSHYKTWIFKTNQSNNQVEDVMSSFPKGTRVVHRKFLQCPKSRSLYSNFTHKTLGSPTKVLTSIIPLPAGSKAWPECKYIYIYRMFVCMCSI